MNDNKEDLDIQSLSFAELHAHTEMSNLRIIDSTNKVEDLVEYAFKLGLKGVAISDHEALCGHIMAIKKYKEIMKHNKNSDFKLILGNEIYLNDEQVKQERYFHFLLLAKDSIGHRQLRQLSSDAWFNSFVYRSERVITTYDFLKEIVNENKGHLIGSTACLGGEFPQLLKEFMENKNNEYRNKIDNFLEMCISIFGMDDFYIELQPSLSLEQIEFNKMAIHIAKVYGLKWIITNDVHYLSANKRKLHEAFLQSKEAEREMGEFYESCYFKKVDEMWDRMQYISKEDFIKGINNTMDIYDKIETYDLAQDTIVPPIEIPDFTIKHILKKYYNEYEYINNYANSKNEQDLYFYYLIECGIIKKDIVVDKVILERLDYEFEQLWKISIEHGYSLSSYYTLAEKAIMACWDDDLGDSLVGASRGSFGGSYFGYLMDIVQNDPIKHNLPFWRHIHSSRPELPDVDFDTEAGKRQQIFESMNEVFGFDNFLNIITFKTEGAKSAILTAARGLGYNRDEVQSISSMVRVERGNQWSIQDCISGNVELGRPKINGFKKKIESFDYLKEVAIEIEGLISSRSVHASGAYIFANGYIEQNSLMRAKDGNYTTCWGQKDSDYCGGLKLDFLTIKALDKIRVTMDLLIKAGKIEWQGNLKATYDKYLHPDTLDYDNMDMWEKLWNNEIIQCFQFDTAIGGATVKRIKPTGINELAVSNSIMRLMGEGDKNPIDYFVEYKQNINNAYTHMREYGLTQDNIEVLKKYLLKNYMVSIEQEDVMELVMDKDISNFSIAEANMLRKGIGKKIQKLIDESHDLFYIRGKENNINKAFIDYVWFECIYPQIGYSFSRNHSVPYSSIALIEMNLVQRYGDLFWNTGCLTFNANADTNISNGKNSVTNYGVIATAISNIQKQGVVIALPHINKAHFGFTPNEEDNDIIFGLKGINGIGDEIGLEIIKNQPYSSLEDFINKSPTLKKVHFINLIKSGAFDLIENNKRKEIMKRFLKLFYKIKEGTSNKITFANIGRIEQINIIPENLNDSYICYDFKKHILNKKNKLEKRGNNVWYSLPNTQNCMDYFNEHVIDSIEENLEYNYDSYGQIEYKKASVEKVLNKIIKPFEQWLKSEETLKLYNEKKNDILIYNDWEKYCLGNLSKWEMDSLSFYHGEHELKNIDKDRYLIEDFYKLSETPIVTSKPNAKYPRYQLSRICGTVLDKNKTAQYITLLTPTGVTTVKLYGNVFVKYDKQLSYNNGEKKVILEESWFKRGTKLMICGFRRGDTFVARKYATSVFNSIVGKIKDINNEGVCSLQTQRGDESE